ncbi:uncharacterized protein LOC133446111 [Cololabis saira]|uniref:uncharacterized protein LOC133446111 n=1 Tax=Cololabis saira TaxID=129043 RepID=UPI002AD2AD16|nr:uncharacterized protein LOC133446111 [Cololabis saira]
MHGVKFTMYLENSEQSKVSGDGALSTEAILSEKCVVPKVTETAGLSSPSKGSAELGIKGLADYTGQTVVGDMDPALLCEQHGNSNAEETESSPYCNGNAEIFEQYSASDGFFESGQNLDETETAGLSRPFDGCAQHCECFRLYKSSELCANHSLASICCPCCEHCPKHLRLFQQCKPSDQQSESSDFEPDEVGENCDSFQQHGRSYFTPESTDRFELRQQYEPLIQQGDSFDSEQDTSTEDSEQSFSDIISDSLDAFDCSAKPFDYDESLTQTAYMDNDEEHDESYEPEQNEMELSDEESPRLSDDTPIQVDFDDNDPFTREFSETPLYEQDNFQLASTAEMTTGAGDSCGNDDDGYEPTQLSDYENSVDFWTEEDGRSECSSVESRSFKTCLDDSFPSDPCSDSSEESDKGAQEDSSDDQIQWESFEEEDEDTQESNTNRSNEDTKKTPTADVVIEDFFDFFDRVDPHAFAQKRQYISCFDGGDVHYRLHLEEEAQKRSITPVHTFEDLDENMNEQEDDVCSEEAPDESDEVNENQSEDWTIQSHSSSTQDEAEEDGSERFALDAEDSEEAEYDEASDRHVCDVCDQELEVCRRSVIGESMFAPCAKEISVEGDAYEDQVSTRQKQEHLSDNSSAIDETETNADHKEQDEDEPKPELSVYLSCSEMEPYWTLVYADRSGEFCESGVEEYFAYQIRTIQTSWKQALNGFISEGQSKYESAAPRNETEEALSSLPETKSEPYKSVTFEITDITDLESTVVEETANEQSAESEEELNDISREIEPPLGIIHSIVLQHANEARDSEEEQSDDESYECCECEHCCPPVEQVPEKPLLSQIQSNDAGKICVVIDLDETLVHSSFKPVNNADFIIPVEIEGTAHQVHVLKRPHVDEFLKRMGELFECVLFTASLSKYADPVSDLLDKCGAFSSRLFREACVFHKGNYVKDLSRLGRDLSRVIIIDNSPASYIFHPENAVSVVSWFNDTSDTELLDLIPFFERLNEADDIYDILKQRTTSS